MVADKIRYVTCKLDKARFRLYNTLSIEIWHFQAIPGNTILTRALSTSIYFADAEEFAVDDDDEYVVT